MVIATPLPPETPHRRRHPRLRTQLPGRIETVAEVLSINLLDISASGARFEVVTFSHRPPPLTAKQTVLLRWADFEKIGQLVWNARRTAGLCFTSRVSPEELLATRLMHDEFVRNGGHEREARESARTWVTGHG
ncbi:hypothetical protein ELI_13680 [Erythrobacter litoralis HTCC2594]|uniref:PilZ domain-containing protein n=2 Tax=Erythrobacter litoralis TaxID=39960 RepID=Q2N663_ERYLH|nr:hypothetical protein ELI_13680 [Erythrobacter litoralis HTCC2594]